jgi:hypothetical protein
MWQGGFDMASSDKPAGTYVADRSYGTVASRQGECSPLPETTPYGVRIGSESEIEAGRGWWFTPDQADELAAGLRKQAAWVRKHAPAPTVDPHANVPALQIRPDGLLQTDHGPIDPEEHGN